MQNRDEILPKHSTATPPPPPPPTTPPPKKKKILEHTIVHVACLKPKKVLRDPQVRTLIAVWVRPYVRG